MSLPPTPGQTVGPFFHDALPFEGGPDLVRPDAPGAVRLHGQVLDGAGEPVPDALLEIWQGLADGRASRAPGSFERHAVVDASFTGFGRAATDAEGRFAFTTLEPGGEPPFFAVTVLARGLLDRLLTRAYLPDHPHDALLAGLDERRRATLLAVRDGEASLRFDVRLQEGAGGAAETVFLTHGGAGTPAPGRADRAP